MKNASCKRCLKKFNEKDIYTIQQFQYKQSPSYEWTREFFANHGIGEWDSFCEQCLLYYKQMSNDEYEKSIKKIVARLNKLRNHGILEILERTSTKKDIMSLGRMKTSDEIKSAQEIT